MPFFLRDFLRARAGAVTALGFGFAVLAPLACLTPLEPDGVVSTEGFRLPQATLHFKAREGPENALALEALQGECASRQIEVDDPYHGKRMRYVGLPLRCVLDQGFSGQGGSAALRDESLLLRALDGYTRPVSGQRLLESGAYLAYGEPARLRGRPAGKSARAFTPIDRRQVNPAPFYLVWTGAQQNDPHAHPWPYQLSRIEVAPFASAFPKTEPVGLAAADAGWAGYALFQEACAACHSINGEGGKIGPDLNVPRSIVEYRPIPQIRAYIRNPAATRYTSMPAHPELGESDLDALIAYFRAMSVRKDDPRQDSPERSGS